MNVIIYSCGENLNDVKKIIQEDARFNFFGTYSNNIPALEVAIDKNAKLICIISALVDPNIVTKVVPFFKLKSMKVVVLVKDVKHGFSCIAQGADDMIVFPVDIDTDKLYTFKINLTTKLSKLIREYDVKKEIKHISNEKVNKVIAIGSSTGGVEVIFSILKKLPKNSPPVLIVQHMPPVFTKLYSERMDKECKMTVWEAKDGDELQVGLVLLAPGSQQMRVVSRGGKYYVSCRTEPPVSGHIPSANVLFDSVAKTIGPRAIGVILTGMGDDGAAGMLNMVKNGALTIGQDEKSCVVYGMPRKAFELGAVQVQANPDKIAQILLQNF
ncbi:MAG: CheB methylesterase domain-containing protein [Defluviitaleaceae bacterium]|nr:CheB methylesterase domain-containing protein [Defluviitaleaceae bacterium]